MEIFCHITATTSKESCNAAPALRILHTKWVHSSWVTNNIYIKHKNTCICVCVICLKIKILNKTIAKAIGSVQQQQHQQRSGEMHIDDVNCSTEIEHDFDQKKNKSKAKWEKKILIKQNTRYCSFAEKPIQTHSHIETYILVYMYQYTDAKVRHNLTSAFCILFSFLFCSFEIFRFCLSVVLPWFNFFVF